MRPTRHRFVYGSLVPALLSVAVGCERAPDLDVHVLAVVGGPGFAPGRFSYPRAIAAAQDGSFFVADKTGRVQRFDPDGAFQLGWSMPDIEHGKPVGMKVHPDGRLFVADTHYHRVMVFDRNGRFLTTFGREGVGDGEFQLPTSVAFDQRGFVYVAEYYENDRITQWSPDLEFVRVISDEAIDGKRWSRPAGLDIDPEQTLWVADACNHRIVHLTLEGDVLGVFGEFGDLSGQLRYPFDILVTPQNTLLVCEHEGNRLQWFSKDGRSLRTWGRGGRKPGELLAPWGVAIGSQGRIFVVDSLNNRVQIVEP